MKIILITVNYNGSERTISFVDSLKQQTDSDFGLIVVDNASADSDFQRVQGALLGSSFHLIKNAQNSGFSGGNNVGIQSALEKGADWVVLVNNDTELQATFIERLKAKLSELQGIGAIAIQEIGGIAYGGRIAWFQRTLEHSYDLAKSEKRKVKSELYAIGAGMAIPRAVFEKIGLLDDRYFLYFEDADFCARALRAGITVQPLGEPVLYHHVSATTRLLGSALLLRYHSRNSLLFNWKNGPWWAKALLPFWSLYGIIFQSLKILFMPSRRVLSRAIADGILDFYAGKFGQITTQTQDRH